MSAAGQLLMQTAALRHLLGRDPADLSRSDLEAIINPGAIEALTDQAREILAGRRQTAQLQTLLRRANGQLIRVQVSLSALQQRGGDDPLLLLQIVDAAAHPAPSRPLQEGAMPAGSTTSPEESGLFTDPLTALPLRPHFHGQLQAALRRCRAAPTRQLAVLSVGVDRLTQINDALTHRAGDQLITTLAGRLAAALPPGAPFARGTGDTFLVLLENLLNPEQAVGHAERLRQACKGSAELMGQSIETSVSIGIALVADSGLEADALLRDASLAMRRAAVLGRDRVVLADRLHADDARRDLAQLADLRLALEAGELQAWFMPVVDLASSQLCGYEALVRWPRANGTVVMPDVFLPLARQANLALQIDLQVLRLSIHTLASLPAELFVAVNMMPTTLADPELADTVQRWLEQAGVAPSRLHLEITETDLLNLAPQVNGTIERLAALGVRWLIDDFGTGFSSISYLRDLPVHGIKLDRSFTAGIGAGDQKCLRLAQAIAGMAEGLGLATVAEGVESAAGAACLLDLGWCRAQGWYYGKATPRPVYQQAAPTRPRPATALSRTRWALAVTDSVPVGLYALRINPDGSPQFLFVSHRWLAMLQLPRELVLADPTPAFERIHPEDVETFDQLWRRCVLEGQPLLWEGRLLIEGQTSWVRIESIPQPQADGTTVWQGVMSDITKRRLQENQLRRLLDDAPIGIAINTLDEPDPAITYLNKHFIRAYGYDLSTIPRLSDWSRLAYPDPAYRAEVMGRWTTVLERARRGRHRVETVEARVTTADGSQRSVLFSAVILDQILLVSMQDITDLRETEQQLQQARAVLAETALSITEAIPVGTYTMVLPPDGGMASFSFMSERFLQICGLDRDAATADPFNAFACVHPDDYDAWVQRNAEVFAGKLPFYGETRIVVDGEVRWISAESVPRDLPDGSTVWEGVLIDITERIQAQQQLEQEKERLQLLAENATDVVIKLSMAGRVEWVSPSITAMLGWRPEAVIGRSLAELLDDEEQQRLRAVQPGLLAGEPVRLEVRPLCRDGASRWMSLMLNPVRDGDGQPVALVGGLRDIDQEIRSRQAMTREKARLATTLDALLDPHIMLEPEPAAGGVGPGFRCTDANPAACADLRRTRRQLLGAPLDALFAARADLDLRRCFQHVLESGDPLVLNEVPFRSSGHDVDRFWDLRLVRVLDGLSCSWRDVSDRVESARQLAASEESYRLLAENSSDVVVQVGEDGVIRWVSPSLTAMLGWQPAEWIGRPAHDLLVSPGDGGQPRTTAESRGAGREFLDAGRPVVSRDRVLARDGSWHWAETHASPFRTASGAIQGHVASFRTIDAEVKAEEELARLASRDSLTGLLNRREMLERIDGRGGRGPLAGAHTALLFCDLDRFKPINDRHGHAAGDQVLCAVAERIQRCLGPDDLAARIGGDELLVLLPRVGDLAEAVRTAEAIRAAMEAPIDTSAGPLQMSLSIGVTLALPGEDSDAMIARADAAMYAAKRDGNRVIPIPPPA
ncbi:MAG: diguanylate cyclase [Cyanobacteriota bacterium]|nr:diguanylate cyclase [Cyanobacteriota bacterium]